MPATLADIQRKYGDSVYPLYKDQMHEPYMDNDKGGFQGVVLYDELEDKIRCEECGGWFKHMASHLRFKHQTTTTEYKNEHGLLQKIPLCGKEYSTTKSRMATENFEKNFKEYIKPSLKGEARFKKGAVHAIKSKIGFKNQFGLCDAQILARLVIIREMLHKNQIGDLSIQDIYNNDRSLHAALIRKHGSANAVRKYFNLTKLKEHYEDADLIAQLRQFVIKNKRIPKSLEVGKIKSALSRHFGSWNRAKIMAGLDRLLQEVKND